MLSLFISILQYSIVSIGGIYEYPNVVSIGGIYEYIYYLKIQNGIHMKIYNGIKIVIKSEWNQYLNWI